MRLIWKRYDSKFNSTVTVVGAGAAVGGLYGLVVLGRTLLNPFAWVIAALPLLCTAIGVVTLIREYQLWKMR